MLFLLCRFEPRPLPLSPYSLPGAAFWLQLLAVAAPFPSQLLPLLRVFVLGLPMAGSDVSIPRVLIFKKLVKYDISHPATKDRGKQAYAYVRLPYRQVCSHQFGVNAP